MNNDNVVKVEPREIAQTPGPMQLIEMAMDKGTDIEQLSKLMDMQERWEAKEARKAYFDAHSHFQATVPEILKLDKAHNSSYAKLGRIAETIKSTLLDSGLSYRFEIQDTPEVITVTCIVTHRHGHSEQTTMSGAPDTSGSKSGIQSRASTVSYLQRYTLIGALGLTSADPDNDGNTGNEPITDEQSAAIKRRLEMTGADVAAFCKWLRIPHVDAMPANRYGQADKELSRKEAKHANS